MFNLKIKAMKTMMLIAVLILSSLFYSCEKNENLDNGGGPDNGSAGCQGMGKLAVTNKSPNTIQKLMIDGVSYGTLDPDEKKTVSLAAGHHSWQLVGVTGGSGCSEASVIIVECETTSFSCSGK
jgi:hypothetical protein